MEAYHDHDEGVGALWAALAAREPDDLDRAAQALGISVFAILDQMGGASSALQGGVKPPDAATCSQVFRPVSMLAPIV